ncbi:MAG: GtrA family protein [Minisyncoccia bacterium]
MQNKKDYQLVSIVGFLVGWLILLPAAGFGISVTPLLAVLSVVGFTVFAIAAMAALLWLSRFWSSFREIGKFAAVGTLNSFIDLAILNLLIFATGATVGFVFIVIKYLAFMIAAVNSYFWNKFWTFGSRLPVTFTESVRFAIFTGVGAVINSLVAYAIVTFIAAPAPLTMHGWDNVAAVLAIFANMVWNFLTYKKIVFKNQ